MARRRWLLWITAVALLSSGCGSGGTSGQADNGLRGNDPARLRQQAQDALTRYDKALLEANITRRFVPVGKLTKQIGKWEPDNSERRQLLLAGRVAAGKRLAPAPQPTAEVIWEDGTRQTMPMVPADEGVMQLINAGTGECLECEPLEITDARLTTMEINTTRGPATVPAWEYSFAGTAVKMVGMAVATLGVVKVTPPSWDPTNPPGGLIVEAATADTADSRELTVRFTGRPGTKNQPCGADYSTEAIESQNAIVVIVTEHANESDDACPGIGSIRTAPVSLTQPLGERAVLEVQQGSPIPVRILK